MATISIITKRLSREKLARFLPNHESIKVFESLIDDVRGTLPSAYQSAQDAADAAQTAADDAQDSAESAAILAAAAQELAIALQSAIDAVEQSEGSLIALRAEFEELKSRVSSLEQGYFV